MISFDDAALFGTKIEISHCLFLKNFLHKLIFKKIKDDKNWTKFINETFNDFEFPSSKPDNSQYIFSPFAYLFC